MKNITKIRRTVVSMANRLRKMGLTLSAAFKKAWALVKGKTVTSRIAGVTKGNRQKALARIAAAYAPEQVSVKLIRDTANLYDKRFKFACFHPAPQSVHGQTVNLGAFSRFKRGR